MGVIVFVMLVGYLPFDGANENEVISKIKACKIEWREEEWACVSTQARGMVAKMLTLDPKKRPTARQLLKSSWFNQSFPEAETPGRHETIAKNMAAFVHKDRLKKAMMQVMARNVDVNQDLRLKKLKDAFIRADVNQDGVLDMAEVRAAFDESFPDFVFEAVDVDSSGTIDYTEFLATFMTSYVNDEHALWSAFQVADRDGNGTISRTELESLLGGELNQPVFLDSTKMKLIKK